MEAILFDLDDTLIVDEEISREAMRSTAALAARLHGADPARFLADAGRHSRRLWATNPCLAYCDAIGISAEEGLWGEFEGDLPDLLALKAWTREFRSRLFNAVLREQELGDDDGALAAEFASARRRLQRLMPNAKETLVRLKSRYAIGLLTNGAPDLQREKLAASGLATHFDAVVVSGEHGIGKPEPAIFNKILSDLGASPATATMVGNSLARDVLGAKNAGIARTVWIKVPGSEEFAEATPDLTITGLHELPGLLGMA